LKIRLLTFLLVALAILAICHFASRLTFSAAAFDAVPMAISKGSLVFNIPYQSTAQQKITLYGLADVNNTK
jgi:hypothetical protein